MFKTLATATALMACVGAAHAALPASISLGSGYCDYLTDLTPVPGGGYAGTWANVSCAGVAVRIGGAPAPASGLQAAGVVMGSMGLAAYSLGSREATFWLREDKTWRLYNYQGVLIGKGTWAERSALTPGGQRALLAEK